MRFGAIANSARGGLGGPPPIGDRVKDLQVNFNNLEAIDLKKN